MLITLEPPKHLCWSLLNLQNTCVGHFRTTQTPVLVTLENPEFLCWSFWNTLHNRVVFLKPPCWFKQTTQNICVGLFTTSGTPVLFCLEPSRTHLLLLRIFTTPVLVTLESVLVTVELNYPPPPPMLVTVERNYQHTSVFVT